MEINICLRQVRGKGGRVAGSIALWIPCLKRRHHAESPRSFVPKLMRWGEVDERVPGKLEGSVGFNLSRKKKGKTQRAVAAQKLDGCCLGGEKRRLQKKKKKKRKKKILFTSQPGRRKVSVTLGGLVSGVVERDARWKGRKDKMPCNRPEGKRGRK